MGRRRNQFYYEPVREKKRSSGCLTVLLFLAASFLLAGFLINRSSNSQVDLLEENVRIMSLDQSFEGFRVLHISDLQASSVGSDAELWNRLLTSRKWNAAVLSGDMVGRSGNDEPLLSLIHTLLTLRPEAPVFFIAGESDPEPVLAGARGTPEVFADWVLDAQKAGAVYLDAPYAVECGKHKVWFSPAYLYDMDAENSAASLRAQVTKMEKEGAQYEMEAGAQYRAMAYRLDTMDRTLAAQKQIAPADLQIAVNHIPPDNEYIRNAVSYSNKDNVFSFRMVDLILSGHYCAGQYRLPWGGAVYAADKGFFPPDEGLVGMSRVNSMNLYVSPGLGSTGKAPVKTRLFNRPAATILKFTGTIE